MKTTWQVMLALAVAAGFTAFAKTNSSDTVTLKGTVLDATGRPVEGASVEVSTPPAATRRFSDPELKLIERAVTGSNGVFEVALPRNNAFVTARKTGFAPAWLQFWNLQADTERRLVLMPPACLAGVVVDETDKPVAGAEVFVHVGFSDTPQAEGQSGYGYLSGKLARELFNARTGPDGRFRIENFPTNASASLVAQASGKTLREPALPTSWGPDSMPWQAGQQDIRLVVEPAGSVEGTLVVEGGTAPLPIAQLFLQPDAPGVFNFGAREPVTSGADGVFRIPDVPPGSHRLHALFDTNAVPEGVAETFPDWVAEPVPVSVESGQTTRDVRVKAIRGGVLLVNVLSKTDRKPRAQAGVSAYRESHQVATASDSNGVALLRLPPGDYQVSVYAQGSQQENTAATVEAGKTNRLTIELAEAAKVRGVVRGPDGQPAAGLEVRIVGGYSSGSGGVKTDAEGKFAMDWNPRQFGRSDMTYCVLVRDPARNLAVAEDLEEDGGPMDLRLAPAMSIVGRAECGGKALTNATAALVFWSGNSGMHLQGFCINTNQVGQFEIPALPLGRRYGLNVSAPGYGQVYINTVESDEAKRVELDTVELKPANLKLAGQVLDADDKPVPGAHVSINGEGQPNGSTRTDREGRFHFDRVCEGSIRLFTSARNSHANLTAEGGDTNIVLRLGEQTAMYSGGTSKKLKGVVTDLDGKPVAGAQVAVFPFSNSRWVKTGAKGDFSLSWNVPEWQMQQGGDPWLVIRDLTRNLAAAEVVGESVTNLNVQLKPGLTVVGRVESPDGTPLTNAQIGVWLTASRMSSHLSEQLANTDAQGNFEIKTVPPGPKYSVYAKAKDRGKKQVELDADGETNRVILPTFVLQPADQIVAGEVIGPNDKPASGVNVSLSGEGQPEGHVTTDSKGRFSFKVCDGPIRLFASSQSGYANASATPGDTNVVLQLTSTGSSRRAPPQRASLTGKPLPDLADLGFAPNAAPTGQPLLLCLLDAEQRPSRRVARLLAEQNDALKQKGVALLAAQVVAASADSFRDWTNSDPVPFPVGFVEKKTAANRWATGVPSLPWLILRDAQGKVVAEGFGLDELDVKLAEALKK